jgi:hypothetical protein
MSQCRSPHRPNVPVSSRIAHRLIGVAVALKAQKWDRNGSRSLLWWGNRLLWPSEKGGVKTFSWPSLDYYQRFRCRKCIIALEMRWRRSN